MDAYAVFEGGGAKGFAHIGALKAAEERGIHFKKVGGTSAGAIIACLVAAGYTADELLDADASPPKGVLYLNPMSILDPQDYERFRKLHEEIGGSKPKKGKPSKLVEGLDRILHVRRRWSAFKLTPRGLLTGQALLLLRHRSAINTAFEQFGLNRVDTVIEWLEELLQARLGSKGRPITFRDLDMKLRVVAADLTSGSMREFGGLDDADVPVAPAVMASACFPFFFTPVALENEMLVDGGIVSNMPAWIFDTDREADKVPLPTFGFRLLEATATEGVGQTAGSADSGRSPPANFLAFAGRLMDTMRSGASRLQERRIEDYYGIDLTTRIKTLAFHELPERAPEAVKEGRACVLQFFERTIGPQDPGLMAEVLRTVVKHLQQRHSWTERVRASVLLPPSEGGAWARTIYSAYMDPDGDDRLRVRLDAWGVGACLARREPVYIRRDRVDTRAAGFDKYELAVRPADIEFMYAIPIFYDAGDWSELNPTLRGRPFAALVIDKVSAIDDLLLDPLEQDVFANVAAIVGEQVSGRAIVRTARGAPASSPSGLGWESVDPAGAVRVSRRKVRDIGDVEFSSRIAASIDSLKTRRTSRRPEVSR